MFWIRTHLDRMNITSSACPFAVTVLITNHGGMDTEVTIMYMPNLEVRGSNRNTKIFRLTRRHLYQEGVVSVIERAQSNGVLCSLPTGSTMRRRPGHSYRWLWQISLTRRRGNFTFDIYVEYLRWIFT